MRKYTFLIAFIFVFGFMLKAQTIQDFESNNIGDPISGIGWNAADVAAVVADDPLASGNNVLQVTINNYNAAPVLEYVLPDGKTLADYSSFTFKGYFAQGDVGYKDIMVEAYQTAPTAQFANNADVRIGTWSRSQMGSTNWEDITIDITNTSTLSGTIYIAFGINCAGTGDVGGTGLTTMWYADDVQLVGALSGTVTQWGAFGRYGWPIIPGATEGDVGIGGTGNPPSGNWATVRGEYTSLTATTSEAVVITGQLEFIGGDPTSWSALRYALFRNDNAGTLFNANTDSARWGSIQYPGTDSAQFVAGDQAGYGYLFTPPSGTNDPITGTNGVGNLWAANNASWITTNSGNTKPVGIYNQAPARANLTQGIYNWAISVQLLEDGTNEVRWYLVKEDNSFWFGGTAIDTVHPTASFNGIIFGINNGSGIETTGLTQLNLMGVEAGLGQPIEVPPAPWQKYYVDEWGALARYGWPILNDETTIVGDAGIGGTGNPPSGNWATVRGAFRGNVTPTDGKAIIITGQLEFIGGGATSWSALRYALFRHDSAGTLFYANTDSARWGYTQYAGTDSARFVAGNQAGYGYLFTPPSGTNDPISGTNGVGNLWANSNAGWITTNDGRVRPVGIFPQAPARATMTEGLYNWAISVQPLEDGTNEVRWYLIKEDSSFWFGGIAIDTVQPTTGFNGIIFGINNGNGIETTGLTQLNLIEVEVDLGDPIDIPRKPFDDYYVDMWGFTGNRFGGWSHSNPGNLTGNSTFSGEEANTELVAVRGGFIGDFTPFVDMALAVKGKIELVGGGFEGLNGLSFGLFYSDSAGSYVRDTASTTLPDSSRWTGSEDYNHGYLFLPPSGTNAIPSWNGTEGTVGAVVNGVWYNTNAENNYVLSSVLQSPAEAVGTEGEYDFELYVHPLGDGTNMVKCNLVKDDGSYSWIISAIDNNNPLVTDKFNSIAFALNNWSGSTTTSLILTDVEVDTITITDADDIENELPTVFALSQNYPNPFNPVTIIEFALPQNSEVNLVVYDILGREVAKLASGNFNAGHHKINFNASHLASGVYFYRIEAGDFASVKKLMLLK